MDIDQKIDLIARSPTEEIVTEANLRELLNTNPHPRHYIGLEPSGPLHIGSLVLAGFKINDLLRAGIRTMVFLGDWHGYINNKFDGDWEKINMASDYYEEAFKFFCPGIEVVRGSELYSGNDEYWKNVIKFSKNITLARAVRCLAILGRSEKEKLDFAQYIYPSMQSIDIEALDVNLVHAGMDQRKVHMLVRDVFPKMGWVPPVALHLHLLPGLGEPIRLGLDENPAIDMIISSKMSKSKPWTSVFIHDSTDLIVEKLKKAWSPEGIIENNPVLEYAKYVTFHDQKPLLIERPKKFGGDISLSNYEELEREYKSRRIHPLDLKNAIAGCLDKLIEPVRAHFVKKSDLLQVYS